MRDKEVRGRILVVDDEANARNALAELLSDEGFAVRVAPDAFKGLSQLAEFSPHVVLTDLKMPGMDGLDFLLKIKSHDEDIPVIVMTAFGAVDTAVSAMRKGADDYLTKPLNVEELLIVLEKSLERARLRQEARALRDQLRTRANFDNIVGQSPEMRRVFEVVGQVAASRATVLVTGESGTGKELIAAAIHHHSPRAHKPFIKLHCAALAETLLESELFGHERGAFTGADRRREGRFELANGGTLFLDEVAEIPPATQVKLLRVLQEREFERVGGEHTISVDVRVVAATNRDLKQLVEAGKFREDLFYRLNVVNIRIPSLRERVSDIMPLTSYFIEKYSRENGKQVQNISDAALAQLAHYNWPGNVRELENAIERAVVMCVGPTIETTDLPSEIRPTPALDAEIKIPGWTMAELERHAILKTLEATAGSTARTADILGISVRKVQYKLQEFAAAPKAQVPAV